MVVQLTADVSLNGGSIDATVYEEAPTTGPTATPIVQSFTVDSTGVTIETTTTLNGGSIQFKVFEDTDQDGTAENTDSVVDTAGGTNTYDLPSLSGGTGNDYWVEITVNPGSQSETVALQDGTNTYTLNSFDGLSGVDYWIDFSISTPDAGSTPVVNSATVDTNPVQVIGAQAATLDLAGQNAALAAGAVSIQAAEAPITLAPQNAAVAAGTVSIQADPASITTQPQDGAVVSGEAVISAPKATLQITAQNAGRVFDSTTLSGTVTLNGSGVEGAKIYCIDDTNGNIAEETTTDANGDYKVRVDTGDLYHMVVQYEDGSGNQYNDESKPFIAT